MTIISVRAKESGAGLVIITALHNEKKQKYTVTEGTYREIGCPLSGEVLDLEAEKLLTEKDEERRAIAKALSLLSFSDNSERSLRAKLTRAGFSRAATDSAVKECVMRGYLDEERMLECAVRSMARELYGKRKMLAKLSARGFSQTSIIRAISALEDKGEVDFAEMKHELLSKKLDTEAAREEKLKLLHRYGYI